MNEEEKIRFETRLDLSELQSGLNALRNQLRSIVIGQDKMIDQLLAAILANGHVLIEGVPGIAKTLTAKMLAKGLALGFSRIQFTPDLMPADILGTSVFDPRSSDFSFRKGPVFSNLILIDEINRAPAKTQAALFEVMEERQITIDGQRYALEAPFLVVATQNPIEQEGTYRLPEAQLDRFLFKITMDYPALEHEIDLLQREHQQQSNERLNALVPVLNAAQIAAYQQMVRQVIVSDELISYIAQIVVQTRENPMFYLGASPRASIALLNAAKAFASMNGRDFVTPEDVRQAAAPVLNHRVIVAPEREMEGIQAEQILEQILEQVAIPR